MANRHTVRLGTAAIGSRMDVAIVAELARMGIACTRSRLVRAFAAGKVVSAGRAIKPGRTVEHPMQLEVEIEDPPLRHAFPEPLPLTVLYEDETLLVIDKPAGMPVHVGPGHDRGTLVNAVLHHLQRGAEELPVLSGNDVTRPGIIHRLDRDTSGVLLVAKEAHVVEPLARQFRVHSVQRSYLGLVAGVPAPALQRIETLHGRDPRDRRRFSPRGRRGRRAVTRLEVIEVLHAAALARFTLETGRTHQIRMHARHVGHPVLGDALYGTRASGALAHLDRHALHASELGFRHPATGELLRFSAPLPEDLAKLLEELRAGCVP